MEKVKTSFKCARCGACCKWPGYVRLGANEPDRITEFLNMDVGEFIENYTVMTADRRNLTLVEKEDGSCVFYSDAPPQCRIYGARPQQCSRFPANWDFPDWKDFCRGEGDF